MIAHADWIPESQDGMSFQGVSQSGHAILFDATADHAAGPSPMEAVLAALCGCTSVDVVSILKKKRQPLTGLRVSAVSEQAAEPPRVFTKIVLTYTVSGALSRKAVEDAVALSKEKYCSVSRMLESSVEIHFLIEFADGDPLP